MFYFLFVVQLRAGNCTVCVNMSKVFIYEPVAILIIGLQYVVMFTLMFVIECVGSEMECKMAQYFQKKFY